MHVGVQFSVLGPVRLHKQGVEAGAGQPRQCAVHASLSLRAGKPVSPSKLVADVWGDDAPPSAVGSVCTYVYRLRQTLGEQSDSSVSLVEGGYLLHTQRDALDLNRFKETTASAREARSTGDLASATSLLTQGLETVNASASARRRNCSKSTSSPSPDDSSSRKAPTARRARHRRPRMTLRLSSQSALPSLVGRETAGVGRALGRRCRGVVLCGHLHGRRTGRRRQDSFRHHRRAPSG
ncbi:winged helix-turn-helix domain-containing protein [Streptomyces sp. NPDC004546]|uniref:AfsR/SARP family transcriptional regulator n=1 Tax=Streptomyces sp. NPDC004546 TaxID=3154282 RepID=UPI0033AFCBE8